eukprot:m.17961 g.17961  ORF g.17961 m.17961 type:complete len:1760 (+) comp11765_c0_seq1:218-5497(+)
MGAYTLLVWKNFTLLKRRPKGVAAQVLLPCLMMALLIYIRTTVTTENRCPRDADGNLVADATYVQKEACDFRPYGLNDINEALRQIEDEIPQLKPLIEKYEGQLIQCNNPADWLVAYSPNNATFDQIISGVNSTNTISGGPLFKFLNSSSQDLAPFQGFPDAVALETYLTNLKSKCKIGIAFSQVGSQYSFDIRYDATPGGYDSKDRLDRRTWHTNAAFPPGVGLNTGPRKSSKDIGGDCSTINSTVDIFATLPLAEQFGYCENSMSGTTELETCFSCILKNVEVALGSSDPGYYKYQFLAWSSLLTSLIANQHLIDSGMPEDERNTVLAAMDAVKLQRFPYSPYTKDGFLFAIQFGLPLLLLLAYIYTTMTIVRNIVHEKERRLKESMKMMGLPNWAHWSAWYTQSAVLLFISNAIMALELEFGQVLRYSDSSLIFVFLLLFSAATISFSFLVSTLFSKATNASVFAAFLWYMSYFPYQILVRDLDTMSSMTKTSYCTISTTCMSLGAYIIAQQEGNGVGITWENAFKSISVDDDFNFGQILSMLGFDAVVYFILAWYIDQVFPGEFGIAQRWYFPFNPRYWMGETKLDMATNNLYEDDKTSGRDTFEAEPTNFPVGVSLQNLRKEFGKTTAVKGTTLNMFEGEILSLLGHNGAGKTTTMSMITGLFAPTSGSVVVNGHNVVENPRMAQKSLGICPQHDVLFDTLTVSEHLMFFCRLKGIPQKDVPGHVNSMIKRLKLEDKRNVLSKALSGGMKRRLSCGMAFVGGSKVVILDEPTSGMDPAARRATWDLISELKQGRTIVLSTHFMDEADLLGDRIAIMSDGVVKCCGSSLYLKRRYGAGYSLIMEKAPVCDVDAVLKTITTHVIGAKIQGNLGAELNILLPNESAGKFASLFADLDSNLATLGIQSYGCSVTTLEEVFLKVGEGSKDDGDEVIDIQKRIKLNNGDVDSSNDDTPLLGSMGVASADKDRITGTALLWLQFQTMMTKRRKIGMRSKFLLLGQLIPPLFFTMLTLALMSNGPVDPPAPLRSMGDLVTSYGEDLLWYVQPNAVNETERTLMGEWIGKVPTTFELPPKQLIVSLSNGSTSRTFEFISRTPIVMEENNGEWTCWYNGQAYHSIAECINIGQQIILAKASPSPVRITTNNFPLPMSDEEKSLQIEDNQTGFFIAFAVLFGTAPLVASFAIFAVTERERKSKHVQFVSGLGAYSYWISNFVWDFFNYLIPILGVFALFAAFKIEAYIGDRFVCTVAIFVLYGLSVTPLMYCCSFLFTTPSIAFVTLTLMNIVTGLAFMVTINILSVVDPGTAGPLSKVFMILPNYCFGQSLMNLYEKYTAYEFAKSSGYDFSSNINDDWFSWDDPGVGRYLVAMAIETVGFTVFLFLVEKRVFISFKNTLFSCLNGKKERAMLNGGMDSDIIEENARVGQIMQNGVTNSENLMVIDKIGKVYQSSMTAPPKRAVRDLSLAVRGNECFGLLGVNGAGKTTTFKMLTGDENISSGAAYIKGFDVTKDMTKIRQYIGYCPQYDALQDMLTGREILTMFAQLRGMRSADVKPAVDKLISFLMLEKHADKLSKSYSGGNKRKLSTAIALIGDPQLLFLDEPTTGMDPGARRFLWNALIEVLGANRSIVLTSHSMEECEALCTRLAIMVDGQFQCIGGPQHLKQRYGQGYSLIVKLGDVTAPLAPVKTFVASHFEGAILKEEHQGLVRYEIHNQTLAHVFGTMENAKVELNLEDYSVTQATLEQVFLDFAAKSASEDDAK